MHTLRPKVLTVLLVLFALTGCDSAEEAPTTPVADGTPQGVVEAPPKGRVIILGFDGADPNIVEEMLAAGELPNLAKLRAEGSFQRLGTTTPPQSPTAWSTFNTSRAPLNHGIFDFLRRNPKKYAPGVGAGSTQQPKLAADGSLKTAPWQKTNRQGDNFWKVASDQGFKVKALMVPFAYPADELSDECRMLSGLDVPDIRGTSSTYFAISESFTGNEPSVGGGKQLSLLFKDNTASVNIPGLAIPGKGRQYAEVPLGIKVDRTAKEVTIQPGADEGESITLKEGEWSKWVEWTFPVSDKYKVQAISRFHVMEAGAMVRLYMTCLQFHPKAPFIPFSSPPEYAAEVSDRYGLYKTIGWAYDTKALQHGDMTEEMFLADVRRTMAWREQLMLDELDRGNFDLLVAAYTGTDRVAHMFWGYRDPKHPIYTEAMNQKYGKVVEETYEKMDSIVGNVMSRLQEDDLLMVMSDHGFHSFRTQFSVNTWLIRNGYLAVKGQTDSATAYNNTAFLDIGRGDTKYDWSKTKAYGLGLGMIFLNMEGREGQGTVKPDEAPALIARLQEELLVVTDPETGDNVFRSVHANINPEGAATADTPDLQLGYADGYQTNKASATGAAPKVLFSPNENKWSGEHASSDAEFTSGILFSNQVLASDARIEDFSVTAFSYLNASKPSDFEGKPLL